MIAVWVPGAPAAQGSKRYVGQRAGRAVLVEQSKKVKPWRDAVTQLVRLRMATEGVRQLHGPVRVVATFYLRPPQKPVRAQPTTRPDVDKLARAVLDACTAAGVWADDSQVTTLIAHKAYAPTVQAQGLRLTIDYDTPTTEGETP